MKRIQSKYLFDPEVNAGKMIFLSGPRQVGKTTFVKNRVKETGNGCQQAQAGT
jgi:predicted AAA+ superfamily ATPase